MSKTPTLSQQFLYYCATKNTRSMLRGIQPVLIKLPKKKQQDLFQEGFIIACGAGNHEAALDILSDKFYGFNDLDILYNGLHKALENNHIHVAQYALEQSKSELTKHAGGEPLFSYNMNLFSNLFGQREMINPEAVEFLANYIETHVKQKGGEDFNLLSYQDYRLFKRACDSGNKSGAEFLINRYNITGEEPAIKAYLTKIQTNPTLAIAEHIKTLIRINLEKTMLEAEIGTATENKSDSIDSRVDGDLEKNRRKNKI